MLTNINSLERLPTFKGEVANILGMPEDYSMTPGDLKKAKGSIAFGFLGYPVLQSADILLYKPDAIPVGEDQLSHL
jgi:tryptophanyl-tRNA synthetase